jgi:diadenosine tetraphosphate (Ap4A) HIT family hydrolase
MGLVVRLAFGRLWWLLPVRKVGQTARVLAFEHPAPSWQPHLLLVPKRAIRSLLAAETADVGLVGEIVRLGLGLALRRGLAERPTGSGFALMVNGGTYQDVPQLHFHLAGLDNGLRYTTPTRHTASATAEQPVLAQTTVLTAYQHPQPQRLVHAVIWPTDERLVWCDLAGPRGEEIGRALVPLAQQLVRHLGVGESGFTLLASVPPDSLDGPVCFHLVGGDRRG